MQGTADRGKQSSSAPAKRMGMHSESKPPEDLKAAVAALVLDWVLRFARGNGEVGSIVDHAS